jgi:hypothetical protein
LELARERERERERELFYLFSITSQGRKFNECNKKPQLGNNLAVDKTETESFIA